MKSYNKYDQEIFSQEYISAKEETTIDEGKTIIYDKLDSMDFKPENYDIDKPTRIIMKARIARDD